MTSRLTDERMAEIEARCSNATPGPWASYEYMVLNTGEYSIVVCDSGENGESEKDAEFISHARTDIPDLLAKVKALREENENIAKEHKRELALAIDDYYNAWANQQVEMEQLKKQLTQAEAERDVLLHELLKETHSHLCEDPERPCPFDEETEGEYCSNECANADPKTCWLKYAQQQARSVGDARP